MADLNPALNLFGTRGWEPFEFQTSVWVKYLEGKSGLIHSATGSGKTLAAWLGPILDDIREPRPGLKVLWITPLKALAADTLAALQAPLDALGVNWQVEARTGDTSSSVKTRQVKHMRR
jgi:ATP-dependent helicase Lhr and Lhr-like helicase